MARNTPVEFAEITLELATTTSATVVADILTDATARKESYEDTSWGSGAWSVQEVVELFDSSKVYLAIDGTNAVGTVSLEYVPDRETWKRRPAEAVYIHRLAVRKEYAGNGIGKRILELVAELAEDKGMDHIRLDCNTANAGLCAYYESIGFIALGTEPTPNPEYVSRLFERQL